KPTLPLGGSVLFTQAITHSRPFASTQFGSLAGLVGSSGMQVKLLLPLRSVLTFPLASKAITVAFFAINSGAADRALAIISSSVLGEANSPLTTSWLIPEPERLSSITVPRIVALKGMRMKPSLYWSYRRNAGRQANQSAELAQAARTSGPPIVEANRV